MASDNMKHRRLQELGESDFEIVKGQPDIRGWDVKDSSGETIGEVDELILDAQSRKVRYMVVDLDDDALDLEEDRTVLIPIGLAELHEKDDDVLIPGVSTAQLRQLPKYDKDHLDAEVERSVCSALGRTDLSSVNETGNESALYEHDHFNDQNLYSRRLLPASTTAGNENKGINFQEKSGYTRSRSGEYNSGTGDMYNRDRSADRIGSYSDEVEEESLQTVSRDRKDTDIDRLSNDLQDDRTDDLTDRDIERRNSEDSRKWGRDDL